MTNTGPIVSTLDMANRYLLARQALNGWSYWDDLGGHLTCDEADNLARAFLYLGLDDQAARCIQSHAYGDDDPDDQHQDLIVERVGDNPEHRKQALDLEEANVKAHLEALVS